MRITTKSRTAITALIDLALHSAQGRTVSLAEIAERRQISLSYLEQLFATLRAANIVNSFRGPGGGYTLAKETTEISLKDIVLAIDGGNSKKHLVTIYGRHLKHSCLNTWQASVWQAWFKTT